MKRKQHETITKEKIVHGGQHHVKQSDGSGTGTIPASSIVAGSTDSRYLFKQGQQASKHPGANATGLYQAVLSGSLSEIQNVMAQSVNENQTYVSYDISTYTGPCKAPAEAYLAAHPRPAR